jgi:E3 ubiquitin-protein ligase synoviolin
MPSLRDEVGGWMLAVFVLLLAGKVWSWIGEGRVDILEQQPPQNPRLFHARLASSLLVSTAFSAAMLRYCIATVKDDPRPGMMVIFTFEFAILLIFSLFTLLRYVLALTEARVLKQQTQAKMDERRAEIRAERERLERERDESTDPDSLPPLPSEEDVDENEIDVPGWEEKRRWLFGLELATGSSCVSHSASSKLTYNRLYQAHCLYRLLWHLIDFHGSAHAYHSRRLSYFCILRQARTGLQQLPQGHPKHE